METALQVRLAVVVGEASADVRGRTRPSTCLRVGAIDGDAGRGSRELERAVLNWEHANRRCQHRLHQRRAGPDPRRRGRRDSSARRDRSAIRLMPTRKGRRQGGSRQRAAPGRRRPPRAKRCPAWLVLAVALIGRAAIVQVDAADVKHYSCQTDGGPVKPRGLMHQRRTLPVPGLGW